MLHWWNVEKTDMLVCISHGPTLPFCGCTAYWTMFVIWKKERHVVYFYKAILNFTAGANVIWYRNRQ